MRLGLQLTIRQTNVPQGGYPLTVNVSPMQAKSFHGSHARAKTFLEVLAAFLQTPESFSKHLQRRCKLQKVFRGTCNGVANARKFFVRLATALQTPKSFSWDLQQCCKRFQEHFDRYSALSKTFSRNKEPHSFVELKFS